MRVVVTGAAGFIGSHLSLLLAEAGADVVGIDALAGRRQHENLAVLARRPGLRIRAGDVRSHDSWRGTAGACGVVHLAGAGGARVTDRARLHDANVTAAVAAVHAARQRRIRRFVLVSSSSVYRPSDAPLPEDAPLGPVSPYGHSKLAAETAVRREARRCGIELVVVRPFSAYGPRQREDMAFARYLRAARLRTTMPRYGDGRQRRDFTFVADLAAGLLAALERGRAGTTYNLGSGRSVPLGHALQLLAELGELDPPRVEPTPSRVAEPASTCADIGRATAQLGYRPCTPLRDGLLEQVRDASRGARPGLV